MDDHVIKQVLGMEILLRMKGPPFETNVTKRRVVLTSNTVGGTGIRLCIHFSTLANNEDPVLTVVTCEEERKFDSRLGPKISREGNHLFLTMNIRINCNCL